MSRLFLSGFRERASVKLTSLFGKIQYDGRYWVRDPESPANARKSLFTPDRGSPRLPPQDP